MADTQDIAKAKAAVHGEFGKPQEVVSVKETNAPEPGAGEVRVIMQMAPINPADINKIEGKYGIRPDLPAVGGIEGAGLVEAVGAGVDLQVGAQVLLPPNIGTWRTAVTLSAEEVMPLPLTLSAEKAAMLGVNPSTAYLMLREFVDLKEGDWVIQNAGNSNVGLCVTQIAKVRGIKTISLARREEVFPLMKEHGADEVLLDDASVEERVKEICGKNRPRLAMNAVGGESALRMANTLATGGVHVTYGAMGRTPYRAPAGLLIFRDITFRGFWVTRWKDNASREAMLEVIGELAHMMADGKIEGQVDTIYPLAEITEALVHAQKGERNGKILIDLSS